MTTIDEPATTTRTHLPCDIAELSPRLGDRGEDFRIGGPLGRDGGEHVVKPLT